MNPEALLAISGLSKRYGEFQAVDGLSLEVGRGEIFSLLGPNGAGKTTTIRMMMGILQPTAGSARVSGFDCFKDRVEVMRRVGYLPDEPVFYNYLRGIEILRFVGNMHGLTPAEIEARVQPWLERIELADAAEEYAVNYSAGMKKKLGLLCAMLHEPDLLILDEPTNGLDPSVSRMLHGWLHEYVEAGRSIFYSTHLLPQAERMATRVGIIARGRLAAHGSLDDLRARLSPGGSLEDIYFSVTDPGSAQVAAAESAPERGEA